ncbi:MAG TPA: 2-amino-4-hydroxy-6-hydroxymethyldihydropteridine diphosphokinase [Dermatophilaceae bacterium]|nr:2-amino-4-hydroxy-6-hydroxymethyldihydropteridine diphosphokinase [Dermatophilaceae bacterium]
MTGRLDEIRLLGVRGTGHHGVFEHERRDGQTFLVDVVLSLDLGPAGRTDALADTVHYGELAEAVVRRIEGEPYDLIESLAARIAEDTLLDARVAAVEVTVHKPQAPISVPFGDVQVVVRRERGVPVVVAIGANLGDPLATLTAAVRALGELRGFTRVAVSPLVESDPVGGVAQAAYLNGVVLGRWAGSPRELLRELHAIEHRHGRTRELRWGPRTLDLDLVQFGMPGSAEERLSTDADLLLPHPRAAERAFMLAPWSAVDATAMARLGPTVADEIAPVGQLLEAIDSSGVRPGPSWGRAW